MIETFITRMNFDLEAQEAALRATCFDENEEMYFEGCGRVWAYQNLGLLTSQEALAWVNRFATAAETDPEKATA